ncbi:purine operon repressor PurR [Neobacillus bataviensis]|uniref:Purine operon repressor PurR n=1 Tax=Neobacillus bataviensis TaxID=220685 RepID=A0A561CEB4_9BACI|nr:MULTISPECIES: pur operon repressor [Bacillaceae]MCM3729315.1 pur operon repressor [Neobacillus cucumis]PFO02898.1 pur operon repressor [Bacillus sp. AFS076308]PGV49986.1 pur operon repressor [Bacillus sp. AFS037270]TWD89583.1 purine operon repressor PurR [Neobacillus bataviensis]
MKFRRSERLIDMTNYLLDHPRQLVPLTFFADRYDSAKSSISEDLAIVKETFEQRGIGTLQTVPGAAGGVKFFVKVSREKAEPFVNELCQLIANPERLLPGGYLYLTDILGDPQIVQKAGRIIASAYADTKIDVVMTVATKGIPLAYAVASQLNVPVVIVRRDSKVTEGPTVSINYVSGSAKRIQTMVLSKKSMRQDSRVLIVDDFMKAGGTVMGMISMLEEFNSQLAGIAVLVEDEKIQERLVDEYLSLVQLADVDVKEKKISVQAGNYFNIWRG